MKLHLHAATHQTSATPISEIQARDALHHGRTIHGGRPKFKTTIAIVALLATLGLILAGCTSPTNKYTKVNSAARSLSLDSVGPTTPCQNHIQGTFSNATVCAEVVSAPDAEAKVKNVLSAKGYQLEFTDPQVRGTTWAKGSGDSRVEVIVNGLSAGSSYYDLYGVEKTVEQESAIVTITVP